MRHPFKIALVGNPNSGKSSLFNALTGLNQKVGNFPGVTVDKKTGDCALSESFTAQIIDLPGTYSLYPKGADEQVTYEVLLDPQNEAHPHMIVVIADAANLKRNLLFCTQIMDLKIPVVIALTMNDIARQKGISIDTTELERHLGAPVVAINPRKGKGIVALKKAMALVAARVPTQSQIPEDFINVELITGSWLQQIKSICNVRSNYTALHIACNFSALAYLGAMKQRQIETLLGEVGFGRAKVQALEIMERYKGISSIMQQCVAEESPIRKALRSEQADKVLLHPLWGNLVLVLVLFLLFQSIFWLAQYPMNWVETGFAFLASGLGSLIPSGWIHDLLVDGLLAGISGIAVFVPQIMILFGAISVLEDTGYMARITFLTDRLMRTVGLNGRSTMPLISGMACAVPAIMSARTIQNKKERLITIMVTPLMSCSARLPIYTILIALVVPDYYFGPFSLKGLVLMGLYLLGFCSALFVAWILQWAVKIKEKTYFLMELPVYRAPRWRNIGITMVNKARLFITDAGKVIMVISLLLWMLASFGPPAAMEKENVRYQASLVLARSSADSVQREAVHKMAVMEHSFAGILGHAIEPAIRPLGYDWKIGIALLTSFAAREVFVGTMATLYSVGSADDQATVSEKMARAKRANGLPVYTIATSVSLLLFYVFAMQCMSTLAIVRRETRSWKYPLIQFAYMFVLAYGSAFLAYQLLK
jgi:ferrous iron transport protein B